MPLAYNQLIIDRSLITAPPEELFADWQWLIEQTPNPIQYTACGDAILRLENGKIAHLDTYLGLFKVVAQSFENWQSVQEDPERMERLYHVKLVEQLIAANVTRKPGECYSPRVPLSLGGSWEPANFSAFDFTVHVSIQGQIHRQKNGS
jgi:hypothetical protein